MLPVRGNGDQPHPTTIRIPAEDHEWLEQRAAEQDRSFSAELRRLIRLAREAQEESPAA